MHRRALNRIAVVLALAVSMNAPVWSADRLLTDSEWIEDIDAYVALVRETHPDPFHTVSSSDFVAAVSDLKNGVGHAPDIEIAFGLQRLAASIGDGHTWLTFGDRLSPDRLPVSLYEFADGVFIVGTTDGLGHLVGARPVTLGGRPVGELLQASEPYCSRDNEWTVLAGRASWLTVAPFLAHLGAMTQADSVEANVRLANGTEWVETLPLLSQAERTEWLANLSPPPDKEVPMYRRSPERTYWLDYLPEHDAVYVKFNAVGNDPDGPHLVGFTIQMLERVEQERAKKLIIDVRHNGGGNGDLLNPMVRRISENKRINRPGRLFVITGRQTFSAALMFTVRMERNTEALFVGEPGAGKPNSYGEFNRIELPNSKMYGSISSRWHEEGEPDDTRDYVPVDIPAPMTSNDFFEGRDPALEAIFAYQK